MIVLRLTPLKVLNEVVRYKEGARTRGYQGRRRRRRKKKKKKMVMMMK